MKYCFELYERNERRGNIFKGFKTIVAEDVDSALFLAQSGLEENQFLAQIYIPQDPQ